MTYDPYANSFPTSKFELTLLDVDADRRLPDSAWAEQGNVSPAVAWTGLPVGTQSLLLTAFDPDAPIPGGFWHWLVKDLSASLPGLPAAAGTDDGSLPGGATHLQGSMGLARYAGVKPPPGTGTHRLYVCATALSIPSLAIPVDAGATALHIAAIPHTLARGIAIAISQAPPVSA
jgi:Raf kinase inhibitor-like YbhB/YbcL family protein